MPRRLLTLVLMAGGVACTGSTDPDPWAAGRRQLAANMARVQVAIEGLPAVVDAGDTLHLIATLHNPTATTVVLDGGGCGPVLFFEVTSPSGARIHPIRLDGVFTCPWLDVNDIEPGETDSVSVRWPAPAPVGRYQVWAGVREATGSGLRRVTAKHEFEVR